MAGATALLDAVALIEARQPFVLVTVVWRRGPSSGRAGSKAIILADGTLQGWIGGACAEPTVIEHARQCLETGQPELLFLGEADQISNRTEPTVTVAPMACESDGALEVYMEPIVPAVRLICIGRSPAVDALAAMGLALGWDALIIDDGGRAGDHPTPDIVRTKLDLSATLVDTGTAIVVATQGHYDDVALHAALGTNAGYIGLIASEKRAAVILDQLRSDGVSDDLVSRVAAPAGIDLGPIDNAEIAASIMADLVTRRARGELQVERPATQAASAIDPICAMTVFPHDAKYHSLHGGADYWFCSSGCKRAFDADPAAAVLD